MTVKFKKTMNANVYRIPLAATLALAAVASALSAQDWPQWRGSNRDAKAVGFVAPTTWPKELSPKWKVTVGEGVATPALVGDRLFVFSRQDGNEVIRCLDAGSGKELWQDKYDALGATGPASGFSGPRSSPTVAESKVVTLGVRGMLSCLDAGSGKVLWRKDEFQAYPRFHPASSPLVVGGLCIAQLGGQDNGALVAYDLGSGAPKWKWTGESPGYASPVLMVVDGVTLVVAETDSRLVAVNVADGKLVWETSFAVQGRGYNASTPLVDGQTLIYAGSGRGTRALKIEKKADGLVSQDLWNNPAQSVQFNSPVLKDGLVYGLTPANELFCLNARNGSTAWTTPTAKPDPSQSQPSARPAGAEGPGAGSGGPGGPGGRPERGMGSGMRGGRGGGGGGGFGSVVDAGAVLFALTPASELIVFQPGDKAYSELARIKVADTPTHAYPVVAGNRFFIKDADSVALLTLP